MAGIVCKQCGYENPEGSTICEICATDLTEEKQETPAPVKEDQPSEEEAEYFVMCPESQTKTIVKSGDVTKYYCDGCKKEHEIDGFLWSIEKKVKDVQKSETPGKPQVQNQKAAKDKLVLEEVNSHFRIEIDEEGGILGRYGKYGAQFFQSRGFSGLESLYILRPLMEL